MKTIAIITSALNEEACLPELFERINKVADKEIDYEFSIIAIDNGSTDKTWEILRMFQKRKGTLPLTAISMSRTFPFDSALSCGIDQCKTDLAVIMTSDLQDPPETIHEMLRMHERGFEQVVVKIVSRHQVPLIRRVLTTLYYRLADRLTEGVIMDSVSDFRLVSKQVYTSMRKLRENHRFIRGIGSWVGFKTATIEISRPDRFDGESKWLKSPLGSVILKSISSIFAFSNRPLMFLASLGIWTSTLSFVSTFVMAVSWIIFGVPFAGFGTIVGVVLLGFSLILLYLGVLAQYIALIHDEVKQRPLYIIKKVLS